MRIALRKQHDVARAQSHRRLAVHLDEAFALGNQMKDHHALCAGLEERRGRVRARRLVAPGRRELRLDEDRADEVDDAKRLRKRVHRSAIRHPATTSMSTVAGVSLGSTLKMVERRRPSSTSARRRSGATPGAEIRTDRRMSLGPG